MIQGAVNAALEAVLPLTVQGTAGRAQEVEAVIDTGFSGFLTLPSALVGVLGLAFDGVGWAVLADGTETRFDVYDATLLWDGRQRRIYVYATETTPLAGMRLLEGHDLHVGSRAAGASSSRPAKLKQTNSISWLPTIA